jgi:hypothetical protein
MPKFEFTLFFEDRTETVTASSIEAAQKQALSNRKKEGCSECKMIGYTRYPLKHRIATPVGKAAIHTIKQMVH